MKPWAPQPGDRALPRQGTLFGHTVAAVPRARSTDPQTSHDAAARVPEFSHAHYGRILAALAEHGPGTSWDIAGWSGLQQVPVARRMKELEGPRLKRVRRTGFKRPSPCGTPCTVWELMPERRG